MSAPETAPPAPRQMGGFLHWIEKIGNRLPHPLVLFMAMVLLVPLASAVAAVAGWQRTHPVSGELISAVNLLSPPSLQRMLTSAVTNFTSFPPLGVVLVAMLGIGLAERSGFIGACLKKGVARVPLRLLTPAVVFAGVMANVAADAGYVVLIPVGAALFASAGRHPVAGLCAAFAGVSGGFSANLIITALDPLLSGITQAAAQLYQPGIVVQPTANYYFMVASTFMVTLTGWWVTDRVVSPRLGNYQPVPSADSPLSPDAATGPEAAETAGHRGLSAALWTVLAGMIAVALLVVPQGSLLRDASGGLKPFYDAMIPIIAVLFVLPAVVYGWHAGTVRSGSDAARMMSDSMAGMGGYLVLAFFAAQFVAYFQWSNLGLLTALTGADWLKSSGAGPIPLMLGVVLLAAMVNLFIGSASAKWALMAPVLVPLMMSLGFTPELAQAAFRIGDSTTNIITPLLPYFPMILAVAQRYQPDLKLGTLVSSMLPYSIAFAVVWSIQLVIWFLCRWPLGPGADTVLAR